MFLCKRKRTLVEVNMPRGDDTVRHRIITSLAFSVSWVTEEDTRQGARGKFMRSGGYYTRITEASENAKTVVGWRRPKKKMMRGVVLTDTTRTKVNEEGGGGKGIRPKPGWHVGVKQKVRMQSLRVRRTRSARPFCWEMYGQVNRKMVPWLERSVRMVRLSNSFPLSVWKAWMGRPNCVDT